MDDLIEVTREEFHAAIAPLAIELSGGGDETRWEDQRAGRRLVGVTRPGYKESGLPWIKKRYFLVRPRHTEGGGKC